MSHPETNPFFIRPILHQREGEQRRSRHGSGVSQQRRHSQDTIPPDSLGKQTRHKEPRPESPPGSQLIHESLEDKDARPARPHVRIVLQEPQDDRHPKPHSPGIVLQEPNKDPHSKPPSGNYGAQSPQRQDQGHDHGRQDEQPLRQGTPHDQGSLGRHGHFEMPKTQTTRTITWFGAVFCAIFWIVIFLGGLIVLIVYLIYRPRNPRFDVSSVTLNAAYVDAGSLLNADLSMLVNFTNPNKKARVDFNSMIIDLYYGPTLISTQYIEPFSAARTQSRFVNLHMVTSQVQLSTGQMQQLQQQANKNGIIFDVKGVFRVRSNLGSFLRYSYRLYSHCTVMVTSPPAGVLRATRCRTKR